MEKHVPNKLSKMEDREGSDITASHMILPEDDSDIKEFYKDSTVFITGATGFLGKLCMEKILRACPEVNKIYVLLRPKKGKDIQKRFEELFDEPSFDPLKRKFPNFRQKVNIISGDVGLPDLGLSKEDKEILMSEVDCIFHFAATVRFDEKLKMAAHINVRGVRDLLKLSRQMKKLRVLLHVSTAYANCVRKDISEEFYEPPITGDKLLTLVECLEDEKLEAITPTLLGDFPNTYVYTKCVAEDILKKEGKNLPVTVVRPSIVIASSKEPIAGWIDNIYGATGVMLGAATGLLRVIPGDCRNRADMVPADYVVNSCLAAAWDTAKIKSLNDNKETQDQDSREEQYDKDIPIYNCVCSPEKPITWDGFRSFTEKYAKQIPSEKCVWHYFFFICNAPRLFPILQFLLHTAPAHLVDFIITCIGKKPLLVKGYQKINKFANVIGYFVLRDWNFKNDNTQALWKRMKPQDHDLFEFSMSLHDWDMYFYTYTRGARAYIVKDPLETIPQGRVKYYKLMVAHYTLLTVLSFLFFQFVMFIISCIF